MKKGILLFMATALLLTSCNTSQKESAASTDGVDSSLEMTTYPQATVPIFTEPVEIITSAIETEQESTENPLAISPYIDEFEEFLLFPDRFHPYLYREKTKLYPGHLDYGHATRFVVESLDEVLQGDFTVFNVRILECYGNNYGDDLDTEKIYRLGYLGSPRTPLHDRPPLEVGKEYLRFQKLRLDRPTIQASVIAPILYEDGKPYVYGYGFDFSELSCKIPITDWYENQIWKPGIHDKCIAYAKEHDIVFPTFDYKCELEPLLNELGILKG